MQEPIFKKLSSSKKSENLIKDSHKNTMRTWSLKLADNDIKKSIDIYENWNVITVYEWLAVMLNKEYIPDAK